MVKLALDAVRDARARARGRPRRRHGRRAVRRAGHDEPAEGRDGMRWRGRRTRREAHLPRHRHELRRSAARLRLRGLPFDRPARQAHARRRRRRDGRRRASSSSTRRRSCGCSCSPADIDARGRGAVHARARRPHARHRRPARDHRAARRAPADVRLGRDARRRSRRSSTTSSTTAFDPLPGTSKPQGRAIALAPGVPIAHRRRRRHGGARAARTGDRVRLPHRPARLRHRREVDARRGASTRCAARACS